MKTRKPRISNYTIVLFGSKSCGKTSLVNSLINGSIDDDRVTWEVSVHSMIQGNWVKLDNIDYRINVEDDFEDPSSLKDLRAKLTFGSGYLICFEMNSKISYTRCIDMYNKIYQTKNMPLGTLPIVFVGLKNDKINPKEVDLTEIQNLSMRTGHPFTITSAKNHINVTETFQMIVKECLHVSSVTEVEWKRLSQGKPITTIIDMALDKNRSACTLQ